MSVTPNRLPQNEYHVQVNQFQSLSNYLNKDLEHFLELVWVKLDTDNTAADVGGTRVLFEWNNTEAEFDLQFVNPENRYSVWSHSLENEPERIREEKVLGYTSQQFLIDESSLGVWLINIKYLGNKAFQPTYLKTTVYHNYGRPSQSKKVEVFSLSEKNVYRELLSVVSNIGSR